MIATISGDLKSRDLQDLRLLLKIRNVDGLSSISKFLSEDIRSEFESKISKFINARNSLIEAKFDYRRFNIETLYPVSILNDLYDALDFAYDNTLCMHSREDYDKLFKVSLLFLEAEWSGIRIDEAVPGMSQLVKRHLFGDRVYPQIDVIPKDKTGRLGIRGGFNVMAWHSDYRQCFIPNVGMKIYSIDFTSMDLMSLSALDKNVSAIISNSEDAYSTLFEALFGIKCNETYRMIIKASFLQMAYGASDDAIAQSINCNVSYARKLRQAYNSILLNLPIGSELARITQSTSSNVFISALSNAETEGVIAVFPVHDELVVMSYDDNSVYSMANKMKETAFDVSGVRYSLKIKKGSNYKDMERI